MNKIVKLEVINKSVEKEQNRKIFRMKLSDLTIHSENERIYQPTNLEDLEKSISENGQLEPIVISRSNRILSGHRRFQSMKNLGVEECLCRYLDTDNEIITLIEFNQYRQKSTSDILNESRILEREYKNLVGAGRNANYLNKFKSKGKNFQMAHLLADKLGVGTTKLKQIMSIANYERELIEKIDRGEMSVGRAYEIVRQKYIVKQKKVVDEFTNTFRKFLRTNTPSLKQINEVLKQTYPYSLEITNVSEDRKIQLVEHLEYLKKLNSRQLMMMQKKDELEHLDLTQKQINQSKKYLPSSSEVEEFVKNIKDEKDIEIIYPDNDTEFSKKLWTIFRVCITNLEYNHAIGRTLNSFIGFRNKNGFRLLGILHLNSDVHTIQIRDNLIGWTTEQRSRLREHIVSMNLCVSTQPFGHNFLGCKFMSMCSLKMITEWEKRYKTKVLGISTTSLHGSYSVYNSHKFLKKIGSTNGKMIIKPMRDEYFFWTHWLKNNFESLNEELENQSGPTQRKLNAILKILNINKEQYLTEHKRGYYFMPIYEKFRDYLTEENTNMKDIESSKINYDWSKWWKSKSLKRFATLKDKNDLLKDKLFLEQISEQEIENWFSTKGIMS